jgi:hypothetical protein
MKTRMRLVITPALALALPVATLMIAKQVMAAGNVPPSRPQGPCDIYAAAGDPCVAAHSTTRALYADVQRLAVRLPQNLIQRSVIRRV